MAKRRPKGKQLPTAARRSKRNNQAAVEAEPAIHLDTEDDSEPEEDESEQEKDDDTMEKQNDKGNAHR